MTIETESTPRSPGDPQIVRKDRTVAILAGLSLLGAVLVLWQQWYSQTKIVDFVAQENAEAYSGALATFRTVYTEHVVNTAKAHGMEITHEFQGKKNAIPLPATLTKILAQEIGEQGSGIKASLYSKYPFPWRGKVGEFPDQFASEAWDTLTENPDEPFSRLESIGGKEFLRFATADRMRKACIDCHNTHPDSPKTDWKLDDVRGVLEVSLPMDQIRHE